MTTVRELQLVGKDIADVGFKRLAILCTADDPWRDQIVLGQAHNECLASPSSKWCVHLQTASTQATAILAGQICFYRSLINEAQPIRMRLHGQNMVPEPIVAALFCARGAVRWQPETFFVSVTKLVQKPTNRRRMGYDARCSLQRSCKF